MKLYFIGTLAALSSMIAVNAQMEPYKSMYSYFGSCRGDGWGSMVQCIAQGKKAGT